MDTKKVKTSQEIFSELFVRYPELEVCKNDIDAAYRVLLESYKNQGMLLIAGNGGSSADSDHISGELTKSFMFKRAVDAELVSKLVESYGGVGKELVQNLEGGLAAVPLPTMNASNSAFANDVNWEAAFAQSVNALGHRGDVFLGITTSGNSANIVNAIMVAKAKGIKSVVLTGKTGGKCKALADVCIIVPENETFKIQERHLPIYHALCAMVEADLFEPRA